jgi:hypothetical protein
MVLVVTLHEYIMLFSVGGSLPRNWDQVSSIMERRSFFLALNNWRNMAIESIECQFIYDFNLWKACKNLESEIGKMLELFYPFKFHDYIFEWFEVLIDDVLISVYLWNFVRVLKIIFFWNWSRVYSGFEFL